MGDDNVQIEVFFDGDCPLCTREIAMLRRLDRRGRIRFTDIADPSFDPASIGTTMSALMDEIHARRPDGSFVRGVEVFRLLYGAVGFGPLVWLSRLPGVDALLEVAYAMFARNRLRWTGRCKAETCPVPAR
ncbi:MAG: DUF393 domain-containing protein [Deltaproteobacteria bacterium]|nr:DUF393 domain-containing protein [Deltaproteobacteria bacterium]